MLFRDFWALGRMTAEAWRQGEATVLDEDGATLKGCTQEPHKFGFYLFG